MGESSSFTKMYYKKITTEEIKTNLKDVIEGLLEVANENHTVEKKTQIIEVAVGNMFLKKRCIK